MGSRGPIPKASEDRQRRNKTPETGVRVENVGGGRSLHVVAPEPSPEWCSDARRLWDSFCQAPHVERFFTETDWAYAYFLMNEITRYAGAERQNGQVLTAINSALASLLVTEGDRRRLGIELSHENSSGATGGELSKVAVMEAWKSRSHGL